jgi:hypothetical protein
MADEQAAMPPRHGYGLPGAGHISSFSGDEQVVVPPARL